MKRTKRSLTRILAGLLCLSLIFSLGITAFAQGEVEEEAPTIPQYNIDKDILGSITVHKYATENKVSDTTKPTSESAGTGLTTDAENITDPYKPLKDAKFELYRVIAGADFDAYYNGENSDSYEVRDGKIYKGSDEVTPILKAEGSTKANGELVFSGLKRGIYFLQEVPSEEDKGNQITDPLAEACLISVPMVNSATSQNKDGGEWIYDVHVYPKNHISTATLQIKKVKNGTEPVEGIQFSLEKYELPELNPSELSIEKWTDVYVSNKVTVAKPDPNAHQNQPLESTALVTSASGEINVSGLTSGLYGTIYKLVEDNNAQDSQLGLIVNKTPMYFQVEPDNTINWLPANDAIGGLNNTNTAVTNAEEINTGDGAPKLVLTIDNEAPDITKTVKASGVEPFEDKEGFHDWAQYNIGETITYQLEVYIPTNIAELQTFTITDTCDQLTYSTEINVSLKEGASDGTPTLTASEVTDGISIKLGRGSANASEIADYGGETILIQYNAVLKDTAVIRGVGNVNTAKLEYSKTIGEISRSAANCYTITDLATVYTYDYKITKTLYGDTGNSGHVENVEFELYDNSGNKINMTQIDQSTQYRRAYGSDIVKNIKPGTDGVFHLTGLTPGVYQLKEVKTVTGYNLLTSPVEIRIHVKNNGDVKTETGVVNKDNNFASGWMEKQKSGAPNSETTPEKSIINKKGFVLPQTGSMGYLLFCTLGLVMIAGGTMILFGGRKKRIR